jgi:hypothetical protein
MLAISKPYNGEGEGESESESTTSKGKTYTSICGNKMPTRCKG